MIPEFLRSFRLRAPIQEARAPLCIMGAMRTHAARLVCSLAIATIAAVAPRHAHSIAAPRPMHGSPYHVLLDPEHRPALRGRKLTMYVAYAGCGLHSFAPRFQRQTAGLYFWYVHNGADRCMTRQVHRLQIEFTPEQSRWGSIYVMTPNAGTISLSFAP